MKLVIDQLAELISHDGRYWAETHDDHYLIRFNRVDNDRNNLVLMFDLGVTWEPLRLIRLRGSARWISPIFQRRPGI